VPLSVNVGLNKKASHNYQSTGVSINVTAELDATLLAKPDELQEQIASLYAQAENAMERQAAQLTTTDTHRTNGARTNYPRQNGNRGYSDRPTRTNGNGGNNGGGNHMTDSQRRAIEAIARRVGTDAAYEAREIAGAEFDDLTLRQASDLIHHLKSLEPAGNGNGRR
jgi:hypothetical protein